MKHSSLALAFAAIERPHAVQRLVRSVREHFPNLPVYVADQSRRVEAMTTFYDKMNVCMVKMPYDAGVCASRNRLVSRIEEKYFVLCDDDFVLGPATDFRDAITVLERYPEIGAVGGRLTDLDGIWTCVRRWELYLAYDPANRILTSIPIDHFAPVVREIGGVRFYFCDAVLNFCVFRKSIFSSDVQWDERFKSNGEHEDFFLNLKVNSSYRVAYLPTMTAYHHHPPSYGAYRARLRDRSEGWREFMRKWEIDQYLELGRGVRTVGNEAEALSRETTIARFFLNSDVSLRRSETRSNVLEVRNFDRIAAVGMLDADGNTLPAGPDFSRLQIKKGGRPEPVVGGEPGASHRVAPVESEAPGYTLEPAADYTYTVFPGQTYFRYDPVFRGDSDFVVWYIGQYPSGTVANTTDGIPVILRWFDRLGRVLIWETERQLLYGLNDGYWKPTFVEVPPFAQDWAPIRFEMLEDQGSNRVPICTGFLTGDAEEFNNPGKGNMSAGWDVLALCYPRRFDVLPVASQSLNLSTCAWNERVGDSELVRTAEINGCLRLIEVDRAELQKLFLVGWNCLGKNLARAELPGCELAGPRLIALPELGSSDPQARIFGFGPRCGLLPISGWRLPV